MVIRLKPNPDIAASLGQMKQQGQTLVGFALETNDEESNAQAKLKKKNFDFIVLNSLKDEGAGFRTDTNKVTIITAETKKDYPLKSKEEVAKDIVDELERL
jgi:phosphopantothenoylcysteine decarboxylase/phosphopantothenate--cysteine ligase